MKMLDLFSGIGGFALAAKWTWEDELDIKGFCEIDEFCQKVLQKNFPNVPMFDDISKLDGNLFNDIDLITGGFPCQDISQAGRGAGIEKGTRSGLWFEMLRVISEVRPKFIIIENVPMLTIRGGTRVIEGLAEIGYDAEWTVMGANEVGARHIRKRLWIVAYSNSIRQSRSTSEECSSKERVVLEGKQERSEVGSQAKGRSTLHRGQSKLSDTNKVGHLHSGLEEQSDKEDIEAFGESRKGSNESCSSISDNNCEPSQGSRAVRKQEPQISIEEEAFGCCSPREGADYWAFEPSVGRVVDGIPDWVDRIKGLGNAIVPQCARVIMERIKPLI